MAELCVTVAYCRGPRDVREVALMLPAQATAAHALQRASAPLGYSLKTLFDTHTVGVWGRKIAPDHMLREGDRLELYRPLQVDPKVARRERFNRQGSRGTGLFAKRRANSKAGY